MNPNDTDTETVQTATDLPPDSGGDDYGTPAGERMLVRKFEEEDRAAQKLENEYRKKWKDHRDYVAGTQQQTYTVQTNVIAPKLNSLLPYIYARDPEPDVRPSEAVDPVNYDDVKAFTSTLEIVIKREWARNRRQLKRAAKRQVTSAQTVGLGYIKAAMCTDTVRDPLMQERYNTLQDNLAQIDALIADEQTGDTADDLARKREQILLQMTLVQAGVEKTVNKGMAIERVRADDILVCPSVRELQDYATAPWIRQNVYMTADDAMKRFKLTRKQVGMATVYRMKGEHNDASPREVEGEVVGSKQTEIDWVCVRERWSLEDGMVYQWLVGCEYWLAPPAPPEFASERFYPFFQLGYNWVDDRRYPTSDVANMAALQDEYSARRSAARTWRERSKPSIVVNGQAVSQEDVKLLTANEISENIVLQDLDPSINLNNVVMARPIPQMNLAMLDTGDIMRELEMLSGAQDAATGSIQTAKTATEAEILQHGNQAKGGEKVDTLDDQMSELAAYTAQLCIQAYSEDDAIRIAGKGAVWPKLTLDEMLDLVICEVQAGSMGKPNTTQQQQGWAQIFPLISQAADQIAQLEAPQATPNPPGSPTPVTLNSPTPDKIALAECKRALLKETVRRFDDRIDVDQFLPPKPAAPAQPDPAIAAGGFGPAMPAPSPLQPLDGQLAPAVAAG